MKNIILKTVTSLLIIGGFSSCDDFFNPESKGSLLEGDYVKEKSELYTAYFGLGALVADVADQAVFLEGLRGEFLEPTDNAPQEIWDVYNYESDLKGNSHADPKGYYKIINNANDYIAHLDDFRKKNPSVLSEAYYLGLGGGAVRFKVWSYLMIAKLYGEAVIINDPITQYTDINKYPKASFDQIIDQCIEWMENGDRGYNGRNTIRWSKDDFLLIVGNNETASDLEWNRITPVYQALLAELYLWRRDYTKSLENCLNLITEGANEASFLLNLSDYNGEWISMMKQYTRKEHINAAFYSYLKGQTNRIHRYFSNQLPNQYVVKPSKMTMERYNRQVRNGNSLGDQYRGNGKTFKTTDGQVVVNKFSTGITSINVHYNDVIIPIYRASDIYLFMIECLNNLGRFEEASVFLNGGINAYFDAPNGKWVGVFADKGYPTALYKASGDRSCAGVRGRVDLAPVNVPTDEIIQLGTLAQSYIAKMDSCLVEETCLESAGEARGYYAMLRNARNYPEMRAHWAKDVASKYGEKGAVIENLLASDINNWFIKYDLND